MVSDETLGKKLSDLPDKIWRVWAVTIGMAFILGRLLYIQESHQVILSDLVESAQILKTELESLKTQTQTYQDADTRRIDRLEQRVNGQ